MSEDNKNDDWGMTMPPRRSDEKAKEAMKNFAPQNQSNPSPPSEDDWGMTIVNEPRKISSPLSPSEAEFDKTTPNINLQQELPDPPTDDWGMTQTNVKVPEPKEKNKSNREMPQPVFRVSSGERPNFDKTTPNVNFQQNRAEDESGVHSVPYYRMPEIQNKPTPVAEYDLTEEARPKVTSEKNLQTFASASGGNLKWILILVGMFVFFLILTGGGIAAYFLFLNSSSQKSASTSQNPVPSETTSSDTSPEKKDPSTADSSTTPASLPSTITYKGEMVLVAGGEFTMGSGSGEEESKPAHKVNVPAFYIDKYEVTNAQYKEFCDATGRKSPPNPPWDKNYFLGRPNAPVLGVSFHDAKAYAEWAGKRLPTEQEWEKAASWNSASQTKFEFPWGNVFEKGKACFGLQTTSDVGKFPGGASPSGAMDMAGNVLEWVDSYFQPYPNSSASNPAFGEINRVVRGGFYASKSNEFLKVTKRIYLPPDTASTETETELRISPVGFRCAISADDPRLKDLLK